MRTIASIAIALFLLAGCGSSSPAGRAHQASICLRNALINASYHAGSNCGDSTMADHVDKDPTTKIAVRCTHQQANQYVCDVTGPGTNSNAGPVAVIQGGFYNVTFDTKSIYYQRQ